MITAAEPSAGSQIGGVLFFVVLAVVLYCLAWVILVGILRAAGRRRPKPPQPEPWWLDTCSRCPAPGTLIRREQSSRQLVRACAEHAAQGEREGWWAPDYPFDRDPGFVLDEARRITRSEAS